MKTIKEASKEYMNNSFQTKAFLNVNYEENNYEAGYNDSLINNTEEAFKAGAEFGAEFAQELKVLVYSVDSIADNVQHLCVRLTYPKIQI